MSKAFHYLYKTTCTITNKFYIGMHSTNNLDDGYKGSGVYLWRSIKKYGKENHIVEILEFLPTRDDLIVREKEVVTEHLVNHKDCMNIKLGGLGGWDDEYLRRPKSEETKAKMKIAAKARAEKRGRFFRPDETKQKIREANIGDKNPHFGKCYIYSLDEKRSISIPKDDLDTWIANGWIKGRKIKFD
jgi:group I intron endonuclease